MTKIKTKVSINWPSFKERNSEYLYTALLVQQLYVMRFTKRERSQLIWFPASKNKYLCMAKGEGMLDQLAVRNQTNIKDKAHKGSNLAPS